MSSNKIKSKGNNANDIAAGTIPENNFFAHLLKELDIKRYGHAIPIKTVEVYRYSDEMLKPMPEKALKRLKKRYYTVKNNVALIRN